MVLFQPDYRHIVDVLRNRRPDRLPIYEHIVNPGIMEKVLGLEFAGFREGGPAEQKRFFDSYCRFFREMTYDTVSFEVTITEILPDHGAIMGGRPGPIQNRADFDRYPWKELPERYFRLAGPQFEALAACLPAGMKAVGGVGNGAFEISEDLVGFQYLAYLMVDDPPLFSDLYRRIGDVMSNIWTMFLERYAEPYAVCRMGDDLGFKTGVLLAPATIREFVLPQYRRIIDLVHKSGRPFLWHSCGNIFSVMDDVIALGIDAKHSNEDIIAPFDEWISRYGDRIGLLGGIDVDVLCCRSPEDVYRDVLDKGRRFRSRARGYALGSGNSIPDYVPIESYLAMIRAAQEIRLKEDKGSRRSD